MRNCVAVQTLMGLGLISTLVQAADTKWVAWPPPELKDLRKDYIERLRAAILQPPLPYGVTFTLQPGSFRSVRIVEQPSDNKGQAPLIEFGDSVPVGGRWHRALVIATAGEDVSIRIDVFVDGIDRLTIQGDRLQWEHLSFSLIQDQPTMITTMHNRTAVMDQAWSPDGQKLLVAGGDGMVTVWDASAADAGDKKTVVSCAFPFRIVAQGEPNFPRENDNLPLPFANRLAVCSRLSENVRFVLKHCPTRDKLRWGRG